MYVDLVYIESTEKWFSGLDMYKCTEDNCGSCAMTYAYDSASTYGFGGWIWIWICMCIQSIEFVPCSCDVCVFKYIATHWGPQTLNPC